MSKRPGEEAVATAKRARKYEPRIVYTVTKTHFTDDYKTRGRDWADSTILGTFFSERRAKRCVGALLSIVLEKLEEEGSNDEFKGYWTREDNEDKASLDHALVEEDLDELADGFAKGEFVARGFSIDIEEAFIDDRESDEESA